MRFQPILAVISLCGCLAGGGCSRSPAMSRDLSEALRNSPTFELVSLDPEWNEDAEPHPADTLREHGCVVLGRMRVNDKSIRERVSVLAAVAATDAQPTAPAVGPRPKEQKKPRQGRQTDHGVAPAGA